MRRSHLFPAALIFAIAVVSLPFILGCEDDDDPVAPSPTDSLLLQVFSTPDISFEPSDGTTTVVVQFVARNGALIPLEQDDLTVEMFVDDRVIDVEGILQQNSAELSSNLHVSLVLDASYSMLEHKPPAFGPMLTAARRTVNEARTLYFDRPGSFDWSLVWFDNFLHEPLITTTDTRWVEGDVERIPQPEAGTFTKLYAALDVALRKEIDRQQQDPPGPRDRSIVVAFTDGADNYSWFDNSTTMDSETSLSPNRRFKSFGYTPVSRGDVTTLLGGTDGVQMHVIGLGSAVNDGDLRAIAAAGGGKYFKNPDPSRVDQLFDQVIREFTSVQSHGVTIPLPPGQYGFRLRVRRAGSDTRYDYTFRFIGGQVGARVLD